MDYPYFINPDIEALATAEGEERIRIVRHIAACVGDEATLRSILGFDPEEFKNFYPDLMPAQLSTDDTISSFINRFSSEKEAEIPEIEQIVAAPAIDYASMLEEEESLEPVSDTEENDEDATADAISSFLKAVPPKTPARKKTKAPKPTTETVGTEIPAQSELSEELFKLMVKNKNYVKALEIINELSLNNPKKSVYFAYQKRFLEKLIKNQASISNA